MKKILCPICGLESELIDGNLRCHHPVLEDKKDLFFPNERFIKQYHLASLISGNYKYELDYDGLLERGYDIEEVLNMASELDEYNAVNELKNMIHYFHPHDQEVEYGHYNKTDSFDEFLQMHDQYPNSSLVYWGMLKAKYHIGYSVTYENKKEEIIPYCYYNKPFKIITNDEYYLKALRHAETPELKKTYEEEFPKLIKLVNDYFALPYFTKYQVYYDLFDNKMEEEEWIRDDSPHTEDNSKAKQTLEHLVSKNVSTYCNYDHHSLFKNNDIERAKILKEINVIVLYGDKHDHIARLIRSLNNFATSNHITLNKKTFVFVKPDEQKFDQYIHEIYVSSQNENYLDELYQVLSKLLKLDK